MESAAPSRLTPFPVAPPAWRRARPSQSSSRARNARAPAPPRRRGDRTRGLSRAARPAGELLAKRVRHRIPPENIRAEIERTFGGVDLLPERPQRLFAVLVYPQGPVRRGRCQVHRGREPLRPFRFGAPDAGRAGRA